MSTVPIDNNKEGSFEDMIRRAENEPQKPQWQRRKGVMKRKWVAKHNFLAVMPDSRYISIPIPVPIPGKIKGLIPVPIPIPARNPTRWS